LKISLDQKPRLDRAEVPAAMNNHVLAYFFSALSLLMSGMLIIRLRPPFSLMVWFPNLAAGALAPVWFAAGIAGGALGLAEGAPAAVASGAIGAAVMGEFLVRLVRPHSGVVHVFGPEWGHSIPVERFTHMLRRRWSPVMPGSPQPLWERDLAFWTVPETGRPLLCDIWQPPDSKARSGLAILFFHGSAWYMLHKDLGTRVFFRHLVAQGHVVMDVDYRLYPETDIGGMVGDVKRAVVWMKRNASRLGIDPEQVVLAGASAGGHLSLLAAYATDEVSLTPDDVCGEDLTVRAVIAYYGPSDLFAVYRHTDQQRLRLADPPRKGTQQHGFKYAGRLDLLLGGSPDEVPRAFMMASPISHVHSGCPPTLLIQGESDWVTPVNAARELHRRLVEAGVTSVNIVLPHTNHGFDLLLPRLSPSAQAALYEVDRFLALMSVPHDALEGGLNVKTNGPPAPVLCGAAV
jgi:acetyl esterase/lipase